MSRLERLCLFSITAAVLAASKLYAQSCAMCYTSATAANGGGVRALQHGILILLFPPLLIFIGIFVVAYRRRE